MDKFSRPFNRIGCKSVARYWLHGHLSEQFERAVSVSLSDLETGRECSFDDAFIRLGLDLGAVLSCAVAVRGIGAGG